MKTPAITILALAAFAAGMCVERWFLANPGAGSTDPHGAPPVSILSNQSGVLADADDPTASMGRERGGANGEGHLEGERERGEHPPDLAALVKLRTEEEMERAFRVGSVDDIAGMLENLDKVPASEAQRRRLMRVLYLRFAHMDPERALDRVLQEKNVQIKRDVIHTAFAGMTQRGQTTRAMSAFAKLQDYQQRREAAFAMSEHASLDDMGPLASFLLENAPNLKTEPLYRRWGEMDPGSALLQEMAAAAGPEALRAAARGWAHVNPSAALDWAHTLDADHPGANALASVIHSIADWDPGQAAAWLDQVPAGHQRRELVRDLAHRWAEQDLEASLDWTETLDARSQREALSAITHEWAESDPEAAAAFAVSLPPSEHRGDALTEIAHRWARDDAGKALAWAQTLGPDATRAFHGILETVADQSPWAAADLVAQWGETAAPKSYRNLTGHLAGQWSRQDPAAAATWAESLPSTGDAQRHAIERVADHWVEQNPMAASEWIGTLPQGELRDVAAERLVDHVAAADPDSAYQWALSVTNPDHQTDMLHHVFEQWSEVDPHTARATLEAAPISSEQRQDLAEIFRAAPR